MNIAEPTATEEEEEEEGENGTDGGERKEGTG